MTTRLLLPGWWAVLHRTMLVICPLEGDLCSSFVIVIKTVSVLEVVAAALLVL